MRKEELLREHFESYKRCFEECGMVPGFGNADARLVLVGEAPGKDEVRLSRPFAGKAGRQLDEFLNLAGIPREEIYITNTIKYRLSKTDSRTGRVSNRPATSEEIEQNRPWLLKELDILRPEFIVTLGNVPLRAVTGEKRITIGAIHGKEAVLAINGRNCKLYALYHPASIIYNRALKDIYVNDIKSLERLLAGGETEISLLQTDRQIV